jgi:hypothetical protein
MIQNLPEQADGYLAGQGISRHSLTNTRLNTNKYVKKRAKELTDEQKTNKWKSKGNKSVNEYVTNEAVLILSVR